MVYDDVNGGDNVSVNVDEMNRLNNSININNKEIRKTQNDVEKLENYKRKLKSVLRNMDALSSERNRKINFIPGLFKVPVKLNLFSDMMDTVSGSKYKNAISEIDGNIERIDKKISELNHRIKYLREQNNSYVSQVKTLSKTEDSV